MDIGCVVGKTFYSFMGRDGRLVEGFKFHCMFNGPINDPNFVGSQVATFSISKSKYDLWQKAGCYIPDVEEPCVLRYGRNGSLEEFDRVPDLVDGAG